jgi:palmitoyl-protein thioesterase
MKLLNYLLTGLAVLVTSTVNAVTPVRPIVLMHGILSDAPKIQHVADWLTENTGGAQVINMEIGNGKQDSARLTMPNQLGQFCQKIRANAPVLSGGFNLIGISQGGLLARGYVERCADFPVVNLITWVTPHGGVYPYPDPVIYTDTAQGKNSYPGYWRDPYQYNNYLTQSAYLADLNNENPGFNSTLYRERLTTLQNLVLLWSPFDDVLEPPESGRFATYAVNQWPLTVTPAENTAMWSGLGLDTLNATGRLHIYETDCDHADHANIDCLEAWKHYIIPYLTS